MPDRPLREAVALAMGWTYTGAESHFCWLPPEPDGYRLEEPTDYPSADYSGVPAMEAWCASFDWVIELEAEGSTWLVSLRKQWADVGYGPHGTGTGAHYAEALARAIVAAAETTDDD